MSHYLLIGRWQSWRKFGLKGLRFQAESVRHWHLFPNLLSKFQLQTPGSDFDRPQELHACNPQLYEKIYERCVFYHLAYEKLYTTGRLQRVATISINIKFVHHGERHQKQLISLYAIKSLRASTNIYRRYWRATKCLMFRQIQDESEIAEQWLENVAVSDCELEHISI